MEKDKIFDTFASMFPNLYQIYVEYRPQSLNAVWVWLMDNTKLLFTYEDAYHWSLETVS